MKTLGRIIMFGVAAAFIGFSIYKLISDIDAIKATGMTVGEIFSKLISGDWANFANVWDAGWRILYLLVGLSALAVAVFGRTGFWTSLAAILMLGFFIFNLVTQIKAGEGQWKEYLRTLPIDIILQLVYVGGSIFVWIGNKISARKN